jgi:hypothetical protein
MNRRTESAGHSPGTSGAEPPAPQIAARLSWICRVAGVAAAALGTVVLSGWLLDTDSLKSIVTGWPTMKANAALACILAGVSLWSLSYEPARRGLRATALAGSFAVMAISLFTLLQDIFGWDLGIDGLLFMESPGAIETAVPGRMAPSTALNFF